MKSSHSKKDVSMSSQDTAKLVGMKNSNKYKCIRKTGVRMLGESHCMYKIQNSVCDESIILLCKRRVKYLSTISSSHIILYFTKIIYLCVMYIMTYNIYIYILYGQRIVRHIIRFSFLTPKNDAVFCASRSW